MPVPLDLTPHLTKLRRLFLTLHIVEVNLAPLPPPGKKHLAGGINRIDLLEMRDEFIQELANSITAFVYSKQKQAELVNQLVASGDDHSVAWNLIRRRAAGKFRPTDMRGQFSELLLSNVLQHFFNAAPLLRKMPITTNPALERNGADAIHIGAHNGAYRLYIGEAKTIDRERDCLKAAIKASVDSVVEHLEGHLKELNLYVFEDFLPPELEAVARAYVDGQLVGMEAHPVCLVTYEDNSQYAGSSRDDILKEMLTRIENGCRRFRSSTITGRIPAGYLPRMSYVIVQMRDVEGLLNSFAKELGHVR